MFRVAPVPLACIWCLTANPVVLDQAPARDINNTLRFPSNVVAKQVNPDYTNTMEFMLDWGGHGGNLPANTISATKQYIDRVHPVVKWFTKLCTPTELALLKSRSNDNEVRAGKKKLVETLHDLIAKRLSTLYDEYCLKPPARLLPSDQGILPHTANPMKMSTMETDLATLKKGGKRKYAKTMQEFTAAQQLAVQQKKAGPAPVIYPANFPAFKPDTLGQWRRGQNDGAGASGASPRRGG